MSQKMVNENNILLILVSWARTAEYTTHGMNGGVV